MPAERFPAIELVPKRETQLLDFLSSNEDSDGRGIVIAVLDQGRMVHLIPWFSERSNSGLILDGFIREIGMRHKSFDVRHSFDINLPKLIHSKEISNFSKV